MDLLAFLFKPLIKERRKNMWFPIKINLVFIFFFSGTQTTKCLNPFPSFPSSTTNVNAVQKKVAVSGPVKVVTVIAVMSSAASYQPSGSQSSDLRLKNNDTNINRSVTTFTVTANISCEGSK